MLPIPRKVGHLKKKKFVARVWIILAPRKQKRAQEIPTSDRNT